MSLIGRFEHLPNRPKSDDARPLLEKIASQVKPIMSKRGWKVGTLAEFLPSNPALLGNNMNSGQRINLRLRPPGDTSTFYEYDQLVLVMLHELTHIEHGPHDAKFYKLLAELEEEYYDLKRKGYSGEGFHGQGNHLSGFKVPQHVGKEKGLAAAQKRLDMQRKIGKGGVLGGSDHRGRSMKEVLAEAAERRIRDDKACQTQNEGHAREVEEEVRRAQQESVGIDAADLDNGEASPTGQGVTQQVTVEHHAKGQEKKETRPEREVIVISDDDGDDHHDGSPPATSTGNPPVDLPAKPPAPSDFHAHPPKIPRLEPASKASSARRSLPDVSSTRPPDRPAGNNRPPAASTASNQWTCPTCTLINPSSALSCEACTGPKPVPVNLMTGDGWFCRFCGTGPRDLGYWTCIECGWVRNFG